MELGAQNHRCPVAMVSVLAMELFKPDCWLWLKLPECCGHLFIFKAWFNSDSVNYILFFKLFPFSNRTREYIFFYLQSPTLTYTLNKENTSWSAWQDRIMKWNFLNQTLIIGLYLGRFEKHVLMQRNSLYLGNQMFFRLWPLTVTETSVKCGINVQMLKYGTKMAWEYEIIMWRVYVVLNNCWITVRK